jgi:hypothetical protein
MSIILGSERALYNHYIVEAHLNTDDFEVSKEHDVPGAKRGPGTGSVTVTYKPTGIARQYRDGTIPPSHLEFERELKAGLFETR